MVGLGKPQLHAIFEVDSISYCVNIEAEPPNFGELTVFFAVIVYILPRIMKI